MSDDTPHVVETAAYVAKSFGSKVLACYVANVPTSVQGNEMDGSPANANERKIMDELRQMLHHGFGATLSEKIELKILHGDPAERLAEYADYANSDLIIVGSRSMSTIGKALRGSVSTTLVTRSKKPVLVVK
jgi:nucleotide-binding universal stress UspA family protein